MPPPFLLLHFLFLLLSLSTTTTTTTTKPHRPRRILHQPFFPQDPSPTQQPHTPSPPPPTPKYPFTSTPTPNPAPPNSPSSFFPSYASPPPPPTPAPPNSVASFPANISSLNLPDRHNSKSASPKLIAAAVAAVLTAFAVVSLLLFLHRRNKNNRSSSSSSPSLSQSKTQRSDSTISSSTRPPSNRHIPKLSRPSQSSSEFLYLGTLVGSHAAATATANDNSNGSINPRKLDSPELRPLPPLNTALQQKLGHSVRPNTNADTISSRGDESEEFYSPKGSITGREISIGAGSASRRAFAAVEVDNFNNSTTSSSSSYSSSVPGSESGSPVRSASLSLSPANSLSPRASSMPKSPDLIEIQHIAPLPHQMPVSRESASPSPPVSSSPEIFSRRSVESSPGISNASSDQSSESPVRIASPMKHDTDAAALSSQSHSSRSEQSSPRISNFSDQNVESQAKISSPVRHVSTAIPTPPLPPPPPRVSIPPPPPPPPPQPISRASESLRTPPAKSPVSEPPALTTALRPISFDSPAPISPMELPSKNDGGKESPNKETKHSSEAVDVNDESTTPKPKLKPLHWDKVRASSDREMVWDQLKCSSFKLNEEMIETLFVVNTQKPSPKEASRWQVLPSPGLDNGNRFLDPKKAQNIAILLRALNVTVEEVCEGLLEGNADILGTELLESLLKMAPSKEEEWKLKEYKDDSPVKLGAAERFLKAVVDIPHAFKRVDAMLYVSNFDSEVEYLKKSFANLEAACEELRTSRMFLKLLEAVLKTGNRMNVGTNRGDAHAFKLDTLQKLVDVKGADGKTTLLHFVVQEIIRSEGARLSGGGPSENPSINDDVKCRKLGLQVVSSLSSELSNVKKAAVMDAEVLSSDVSKISKGIANIGEVIRLNEEIKESGSHKFCENMSNFVEQAEEEIIQVQAQESVAMSLVKEITEYFHGNSAREEAHPFRIFMVVRDFLTVLDRVCKEVGTINERTIVSSAHKFPVPVNPMLQQGFHRRQFTSSDEEKNVNS